MNLKFIYFFLLTATVFSCKKKNDVIPNRPPKAFTVQATLQSDGKSVKLSWTKAVDPDSDPIKYAVVLGDTLVRSLSDTTFLIQTLGFNYSGAGEVIATDPLGLKAKADFTVTTQNVAIIPDEGFEEFLIKQGIDKGKPDGKVELNDIKGIEELDIRNTGIKSLEGIGYFKDLKRLICTENFWLQKIDLSKNPKLTYLNCHHNAISEINLSQNFELDTLYCYGNKIGSLNLQANKKLILLNCYYNNISSLGLAGLLNLRSAEVSHNFLNAIDISQNIKLEHLGCAENQISNLNVTKNKLLKGLDCHENLITELDVSGSTLLEHLYFYDNKITAVNVKNIPGLSSLDCRKNQLNELDISKNTALKYLDCSNNAIKTLDLSKNLNLIQFYCDNNLLSFLDLSNNGNLYFISTFDNPLKEVCLPRSQQFYGGIDYRVPARVCN